MKTYLPVLLLFLSGSSFAQNQADSTIEQYCLVRLHGYIDNVTLEADSGSTSYANSYIDFRMRSGPKNKIVYFQTQVQALNYFGMQGWKLVNASPVVKDYEAYTQYIFKRNVPKTPGNTQFVIPPQ